MKFILLIFVVVLEISFSGCNTEVKKNSSSMNENKTSIYNFRLKSLDGKQIDFSQYKGKKILIVNTASECGYTPQYEDLQKLHEKYKDKLVVLGFPCNDFGGQEPGTEQEIVSFCQKNYGVTFPLSEKISVKGDSQHPLFDWLTDKNQNGWNTQEPNWNFCKYLISEKGEVLQFFDSKVKPLSKELIAAIE